MKKSLFVAGIAALALVACKKGETVETADAAVDSAAVADPWADSDPAGSADSPAAS